MSKDLRVSFQEQHLHQFKQNIVQTREDQSKLSIQMTYQAYQPLSAEDFHNFPFKIDNPYLSNEGYLEKFVTHNNINEKEVRKQLTQLIYVDVIKRLNDENTGLPYAFFENQYQWSKLLLKTKTVQEIFNDFTLKIAQAMEKELKYNKQLIQWYLKTPKVDGDKKLKQRGKSMGENKEGERLEKTKVVLEKRQSVRVTKTKKSKERREEEVKKNEELNMFVQEMSKVQVRVKEIDQLVCEFENNTNDLAQEVQNFEKHSTNPTLKKDFIPCQQIRDLLETWNAEDISTEDDLVKFASELWLSLGDYEKELRESIKGHELHLKFKTRQFESKLQWVQQKSAMHIESLEKALSETKLKYSQQLNEIQMVINDMESRVYNYSLSENELNKLIYSPAIEFQDLDQAQAMVQSMKKNLAILHLENKGLEQDKNLYIARNKQLVSEKKLMAQEIGSLREAVDYYQDILVYMAKEFDLYPNEEQLEAGSEEAELTPYQKFAEIENLLTKDDSRIQVYQTLNSLSLSDKLLEKTQACFKMNKTLQQIQDLVKKLGIAPPAKKLEGNESPPPQKREKSPVTNIQISEKDKQRLYALFDLAPKVELVKPKHIKKSSTIKQQQPAKATTKVLPRQSTVLPTTSALVNQHTFKSSSKMVTSALDNKISIIVTKASPVVANPKDQAPQKKHESKKPSLNLNQQSSRSIVLSERASTKKKTMFRYGDIKDQIEYLIESKYTSELFVNHDDDDDSDDQATTKLSSVQIQDLQHYLSKCLNTQLTSEQMIAMFKSSISEFAKAANEVIKLEFMKQQSDQLVFLDCIMADYDDNLQLQGFSLRPKVIELMLKKNTIQIQDLKTIIRQVVKLNQVWRQREHQHRPTEKQSSVKLEAIPISVCKNTQEIKRIEHVQNPQMQISIETINSVNSFESSSIVMTTDRRYDQFTQTDQEQSKLTDFLRSLISELKSRTNVKLKQSIAAKLKALDVDELLEQQLTGIHNVKSDQDLTCFGFLTEVVKPIVKAIHKLKPVHRQKINLTALTQSSEKSPQKQDMTDQNNAETKVDQNTTTKDESVSPTRDRMLKSNRFKQYVESQSKQAKSHIVKQPEQLDSQQINDQYEKYLKNSLNEEVSRTIMSLNEYMNQARQSLQTCYIQDEYKLFPEKSTKNQMLFKRLKAENNQRNSVDVKARNQDLKQLMTDGINPLQDFQKTSRNLPQIRMSTDQGYKPWNGLQIKTNNPKLQRFQSLEYGTPTANNLSTKNRYGLNRTMQSINQAEISIVEHVKDSTIPQNYLKEALPDLQEYASLNQQFSKQTEISLRKPKFSNRILKGEVNRSFREKWNEVSTTTNPSLMKEASTDTGL